MNNHCDPVQLCGRVVLGKEGRSVERAKKQKHDQAFFTGALCWDRLRTLDYYSSLGFHCNYAMGIAERDGLEIIFHEAPGQRRSNPNYLQYGLDALDIYAVVYGVEELYRELLEKGAVIHHPLATNLHGMMEFSIKAPDGYTIGFGESIQD